MILKYEIEINGKKHTIFPKNRKEAVAKIAELSGKRLTETDLKEIESHERWVYAS